MMYTTLFLIGLVLTSIAMVLTVLSGRRRRRKPHVARALTTVTLLVATVVFAYLMSLYERALPEREMGIHRIFSMTVAGTVPLVAITGILLWRNPRWRRFHQISVVLLLLATAGALSTGLWVLSLSTSL